MVGARSGAGGAPGSPRREAPGSPGGSPLPSRKRKATAGPPQPRLTTGVAGPVWLGISRVLQVDRWGRMRFGTVRSFCKPWFEVVFDDSETLKMRGKDLAAILIFVPADFIPAVGFIFSRALGALRRGVGGSPERPTATSDLPPRGRQRHQLARQLHAPEHRRPPARFIGRRSLKLAQPNARGALYYLAPQPPLRGIYCYLGSCVVLAIAMLRPL